jgi:bifunctional non-homologous end joining protein LigD
MAGRKGVLGAARELFIASSDASEVMTDSRIRVGRRTIQISNPDKVLFPDDRITKADLVDYYRTVGPAMTAETKDRLLTMERFPDGIDGTRFFQKSSGSYFPDWIRTATVSKERGKGRITHVVANEAATLVYLANQAAITLHVTLSRIARIHFPDRIILDFDPSTRGFARVRRGALRAREVLEELGLPSFVKTTGSRGLHVVVPLDGKSDFDEVRGFALAVADYMARDDPRNMTIETSKAKRGDRVFVDWLRNGYAQTAVAPYSVRARRGAPVAMPVEWEEIEAGRVKPDAFRMSDAVSALSAKKDPWKGWRRRARSLREPSRKLERMA